MASRLMITLAEDEAEALARAATKELRDPREQARFLLRQELVRQGWLKAEGNDSTGCANPEPSSEPAANP